MGPLWPSSPVFPEPLRPEQIQTLHPLQRYLSSSFPLAVHVAVQHDLDIEVVPIEPSLAQVVENSTLGVTGSCLFGSLCRQCRLACPCLIYQAKNIQYPQSKDRTGSHCSHVRISQIYMQIQSCEYYHITDFCYCNNKVSYVCCIQTAFIVQ